MRSRAAGNPRPPAADEANGDQMDFWKIYDPVWSMPDPRPEPSLKPPPCTDWPARLKAINRSVNSFSVFLIICIRFSLLRD